MWLNNRGENYRHSFVIPPFMPLLLFVVVTTIVPYFKGSLACCPSWLKPNLYRTQFLYSRNSKITSLSLSTESKKGLPIPGGNPVTAVSIIPPTESSVSGFQIYTPFYRRCHPSEPESSFPPAVKILRRQPRLQKPCLPHHIFFVYGLPRGYPSVPASALPLPLRRPVPLLSS